MRRRKNHVRVRAGRDEAGEPSADRWQIHSPSEEPRKQSRALKLGFLPPDGRGLYDRNRI